MTHTRIIETPIIHELGLGTRASGKSILYTSPYRILCRTMYLDLSLFLGELSVVSLGEPLRLLVHVLPLSSVTVNISIIRYIV